MRSPTRPVSWYRDCSMGQLEGKGMPGVNPPSDGGYNYYQRQITDLEDELRNEAKRNEQHQRERTDSLEKAYANDVATIRDQNERTVKNLKENQADSSAKDHEYNKAEVDRIKAATYDKWGRFNGMDADQTKQALASLTKSSAIQQDQDRLKLTDAEKNYDQRMSERESEHKQELEKVAKESHDSATSAYDTTYNDRRVQYDQDHESSANKYEQLNQEKMRELDYERRRSEKALGEMQRSYEHQVEKLRSTNDNRFQNAQQAYQDSNETQIRTLENHQGEETRRLRTEIKDLIDAESGYTKEKSQGYSDAIREHEGEWRQRERVQGEGYEKQIGKMKEQEKQTDSYFNYVNNRNLNDKERYFADLLAKQNLDNHLRQKDLEGSFGRDHDQLELRNKKDLILAQETLDKQLHYAEEQKDAALNKQAEAYRETMTRQSVEDNTKIAALQNENHVRATSSDIQLISPAAEASVRNATIREYEKDFDAERAKNKANVDSIQQTYAQRVTDTVQQKESEATLQNQQHTQEKHLADNRFLADMQDVQFSKDSSIRNNEIQHDRETLALNRNSASAQEKQRREYEEIISAMKNDNIAKIQEMRQESEFQTKMQARDFNARHNDIIHDYDKKIYDQKLQYEAQIEDIKAQAQQVVRDTERRSKQDIELQGKGYEQRIAQLEQAHKERERYITQSYQEDLDRSSRANNALIKKKS